MFSLDGPPALLEASGFELVRLEEIEEFRLSALSAPVQLAETILFVLLINKVALEYFVLLQNLVDQLDLRMILCFLDAGVFVQTVGLKLLLNESSQVDLLLLFRLAEGHGWNLVTELLLLNLQPLHHGCLKTFLIVLVIAGITEVQPVALHRLPDAAHFPVDENAVGKLFLIT